MSVVDPRRNLAVGLMDQRDRWIRLFNRLDAAVSHHKAATAGLTTEADDALYAARDRVLRDAGGRDG